MTNATKFNITYSRGKHNFVVFHQIWLTGKAVDIKNWILMAKDNPNHMNEKKTHVIWDYEEVPRIMFQIKF